MNLLSRSVLALIVSTAAITTGTIGFNPVRAQVAAPLTSVRPFEPAEQLFYEAEFSRSLIRKLDVAEFKFSATQTFLTGGPDVNRESGEERPYSLTFSADVASKGFFTKLFNLNFRERVESTVEPRSFTVQRTKIQDEQGKRVRTTEATFDREKGKVSWTQRDPNDPSREPRKLVTDFSGQLQDILSAIYFIRTQDLAVGKSFAVFITDGGRVYQVPIKVTEKKRMKTVLGRVNVVRVDPDLFGSDRLIGNEKGEFTIWLTDDKRRIPVGGRIKTDYGTFDIKLKRVVYNPPT